MSRVLVLGAGMVARPLVEYLLNQEYDVTVATRTVAKAEALIGDSPRGTALPLLMDDAEGLRTQIRAADVVLSLVPPPFHPTVAGICLEKGRHLITTSYISPAMRALDARARERGLLFLNEI
ncbi:MAG: saccharopine dehydrogenase NADP-binding domain-containing protein, partial [Myxococcota bacterium]|nr:saccharopine dehydrogenase NADP-binding domain-containing protein [Myxococcota bacterium]